MPNLRGASPVDCHGGGHSYAARTVSKGRPNRRRRDLGGVLDMIKITACSEGLHKQRLQSREQGARLRGGGGRLGYNGGGVGRLLGARGVAIEGTAGSGGMR